MFRSALAAVIGMLTASLLVGLIEFANSKLYPFPPGMDLNDQAQIAAFIQTLPAGAFVAVWLAWAVGGFVAPFIARKLAHGELRPAIVVSVLFCAFCVFNMLMVPHPLLFVLASSLTTPVAAIGGTLAAKPKDAVAA